MMLYDSDQVLNLIVTVVSIGLFGGFTISATIYLSAFVIRKSVEMIKSI